MDRSDLPGEADWQLGAVYLPVGGVPGVPDPGRTIQQLVAAVCGAVNCPNGITFRDRRGLAIEWR